MHGRRSVSGSWSPPLDGGDSPLARAATALVAIPMTMTFVALSAAVLSGRALAIAITDALAVPARHRRATVGA
jgi:hypothetical protein